MTNEDLARDLAAALETAPLVPSRSMTAHLPVAKYLAGELRKGWVFEKRPPKELHRAG